jgi:hypothetical protein
MMRDIRQQPYAERARRTTREIAVAVALTLAGVLFLIATLPWGTSQTSVAKKEFLHRQVTN